MQMFSLASAFNANIGGWNTASVTTMSDVCSLRLHLHACPFFCSRRSEHRALAPCQLHACSRLSPSAACLVAFGHG